MTPVPSAPSSPTTSADKPDAGTETGSPSSDAPRQEGSTPKPDEPGAPSDGDAPKDQPVPSVPVLPPASVTPPDLSSLVGGGGY